MHLLSLCLSLSLPFALALLIVKSGSESDGFIHSKANSSSELFLTLFLAVIFERMEAAPVSVDVDEDGRMEMRMLQVPVCVGIWCLCAQLLAPVTNCEGTKQ